MLHISTYILRSSIFIKAYISYLIEVGDIDSCL